MALGSTKLIMGIVITLVAFGFLIGFQLQAANKAKNDISGTSCWSSLGIQETVNNAAPINVIQNNCKTISVDLSKFEDKEKLKTQLGNLITNAWWITHEGKNVGIWNTETLGPIFMSTEKCFVVYEIKYFPEETPKEFLEKNISRAELRQFLQTDIHFTKEHVSYTDWSYIQSYRGPGIVLLGVSEKENATHFVHPYEQYAVSIMSPETSIARDNFVEMASWFGLEETDASFSKYANTVIFSSKRFATDVMKCKIITPGSDDLDT